MTDEQIMKALKICGSSQMKCKDGCPYFDKDCADGLDKDILDLINRQQAEKKRLIEKIDRLTEELDGEKTKRMILGHEVERLQDLVFFMKTILTDL